MTSIPITPLATLIVAALASQAHASQNEVMVITASGFQQKIEDSAASISVVTREQLEKRAYRDVTDALKDVPGVVITGGGSSSDISIRGMGAKYTLMLVDGKRVDSRGTRPNSDGPGIEQGWLPPLQAIERIEVVRGPMSSRYGSDAMGGVINVITRKSTSMTAWQGSVHADSTFQENKASGDLFQSDAYTAGALVDGLLGMRLNGQLSYRGEDQFENGFAEQEMRSGTAVFSLTPDEHNSFDFEVSRGLQDRDRTPGESISAKAKPNLSTYERTNYAITHDGRYDFGSSSSYLQREESTNPGRQMKMINTIADTHTQIVLGDHYLSVGGQYRYEDLQDQGNQLNVAKRADQLTRWSWALFVEDEWALTDSFALTGGVRMDRDQNYGSHWSPRLYGVWHPAEFWTLKGGVSTGYRSPDLRMSAANWGQATGGGTQDGMLVGSPALQPEKSVSEEIALLWDGRQGLNAGLTLFNTDFKDKIAETRRCTSKQDPACTLNGHTYDFISDRINVDEANMRGVEGTANWAINQQWSLASSYTFTQSEQKSGPMAGLALNQMPRHMFNTTVDWQTSEAVGLWSRVNFRSKTSDYLSRVKMAEGTPSYTFFDTGLVYKANQALSVTAGIYNLLDKRVDYASYGTVLDGRRYNLGLTYQF
ncbi:ligand-gated channel protein [Aeromonas rivipollensis]|uniref:ligand-gated channel protein n=1 Tax=Aeromonas rivipollensis TaxID=948519 RepID=UPI00259E4518|nr:ligand-gated channel protein [Aeromonas rivipollensis]MDM5087029.1 ligand-gated channel protein [Aeromonas rivipollensis]MDM5099477.1 ligand-gated channel protein [Aeromonas rivipollensis]MDM5107962.1 ligand-gated channel protein [Aeromonas rivipollensis]